MAGDAIIIEQRALVRGSGHAAIAGGAPRGAATFSAVNSAASTGAGTTFALAPWSIQFTRTAI
jgi:hypothetical protein